MEINLKFRVKELERINKDLAKRCYQKDSQIETLMQEIIKLKNDRKN